MGHLFNQEVKNNVVSFKDISAQSLSTFISKGNMTRELLTKTFGKAFTQTDIDKQESWFYGFNIKSKGTAQKCLLSFSFEDGEVKAETVSANNRKCEDSLNPSKS